VIFDRQGKMIRLDQYAYLHGDPAYSQIMGTFLLLQPKHTIHISTVWLGFNHGFHPTKLLIFETMVFEHVEDGGRDPLDQYTRRYETEAEAEIGHCEVVDEVMAWQAAEEAVK